MSARIGHSRSVLCLVCALFSLGCQAKAPLRNASTLHNKSHTIDTPTTVVSAAGVTDVEALLRRAEFDLEAKRYQAAADSFALVSETAQLKQERLRGLFGLGTALDLLGEPQKALNVYDRYVKEAEPGQKRDEIAVRLVRLFTYFEEYQKAAAAAGLISTEQMPLAKVAIFASISLFSLLEDRQADAELAIGRGRSIIEAEQFDRLDVLPRDVAALYFALGELRRRKGEAIVFDPIPENFSGALETRCQWILDAQSAYSQAMRAADAHWSAMAGVAVGALYQKLHDELVTMPRPKAADNDKRRELFDGAMRLRYSILLKKAAAMLRATLVLREKDQASSAWTARAERALADIERAQAAEEAALAALPYTKEQLQQGLDDLAARASAPSSQN